MARKLSGRRRRFFTPSIEVMEERSLPATFGIAWPDPTHLTLSFAPDDTNIVGRPSNLFRMLNREMSVADWQREILRAFQTWAIHGNISVGVVADSGQSFGIAGRTQHDSRFGDIRVAAHELAADVLSVSVPHHPFLSGTWAGDVFLNSAAPLKADNLFAVALHEAGHVLGLEHSTNPNSPRFSHLNDRTVLTPDDIAAIQALYGTRAPDSAEGNLGNNTLSRATNIRIEGSNLNSGETPAVMFGDITTNSDVDYFRLRPLGSYTGPVTFRLQSSGISLLAPRLTLLDANGLVLGQAQSTSALGDVVTLRLDNVNPTANYFVRVEGAVSDVFGIGRYGLAVTSDATLTTPPQLLDAVLRGPYETLEAEEVQHIFEDEEEVLFHEDDPDDEQAGDVGAVMLQPTRGFPRGTHYQTLASLTSAADRDLYRIRASSLLDEPSLVMTVTLSAAPVNGVIPRIEILDQNLNPIPAQILVNNGTAYTVQASGLPPGVDYYLRVYPSPQGADLAGNYSLVIDFSLPAVDFSPLASGALSTLYPRDNYALYVARSQLFQFNLSTRALNLSTAGQVRMTIFNEAGTAVFTLLALAGDTVSSQATFLTPGTYIVRFAVEGAPENSGLALAYTLTGFNLSEPIGPRLADPTLAPQFTQPTNPDLFYYPGGIVSPSPFFFVSLPRLVTAVPDAPAIETSTSSLSELLSDSPELLSPVSRQSSIDLQDEWFGTLLLGVDYPKIED